MLPTTTGPRKVTSSNSANQPPQGHDVSAVSEKPPLELNRPETDPVQVPPEWGSPDYRGTSLAVSNIGPHALDIVASYLPDSEFRSLIAAEPAFRNARLLPVVVDTQARLQIAEIDQLEALARINRARPHVFRPQGALGCKQALPVTVLSFFGAGAGGALALAGAAGDDVNFAAAGGALMGTSSLWLLGAGLHCMRDAYRRRCAYHEVMAAHQSLTTAQHEETLVRDTILPSHLARLRGIDTQGIEPNRASGEPESKGEKPPGSA